MEPLEQLIAYVRHHYEPLGIVRDLVREAREWLARTPEPADPIPLRYLAMDRRPGRR